MTPFPMRGGEGGEVVRLGCRSGGGTSSVSINIPLRLLHWSEEEGEGDGEEGVGGGLLEDRDQL